MDKTKIQEIADNLKQVEQSFSKLRSTLSGGPSSYYFERLIEYYEGCMAASKFKEGDRVYLREDWNGQASGWQHSKHFLKAGEPATVRNVDYYHGEYCYDIAFDNETWVDDRGEKHPVKDKHTFCFGQKELRRKK